MLLHLAQCTAPCSVSLCICARVSLPASLLLLLLLQVPTGGLPRSLVENAAITLGRIAWMCPEPLAPHAAAFLGPW